MIVGSQRPSESVQVWLGILVEIMVEHASEFGALLGFSPGILGLTLLAGGTSFPDLVASLIVAKQGQASTASCRRLLAGLRSHTDRSRVACTADRHGRVERLRLEQLRRAALPRPAVVPLDVRRLRPVSPTLAPVEKTRLVALKTKLCGAAVRSSLTPTAS